MSLNNGHISDISVLFRTYIGHFYRWLSVPSVFYHKSVKPQMNADFCCRICVYLRSSEVIFDQ